jgi:acyl-CoA thioester hydrolase
MSEQHRPSPVNRAHFKRFMPITSRWSDNDVYGHINNVVYYHYFDSAVNAYLVKAGALDLEQGKQIGLVVQSSCSFFAPLAFPQAIEAGLRVEKIGTSSVRYQIGIFAAGADETAALGHFTHVYVDRATRRPQALSDDLRRAVSALF